MEDFKWNLSLYDQIGIVMFIYPVTKFWLVGSGVKVEGASGINGAVRVWESSCS